MDFHDRQMIKVYDNDSEIEIEVIALIPSKRDDKKYVVYTSDKEIGDEVNIDIGILHTEDNTNYLELVEDDNELNYVHFLMDEIIKEG